MENVDLAKELVALARPKPDPPSKPPEAAPPTHPPSRANPFTLFLILVLLILGLPDGDSPPAENPDGDKKETNHPHRLGI